MSPIDQPAASAMPEMNSTFRHVKRGTTYTVRGIAKVQSSVALMEGSEVVVYVGADGQLWVRPVVEFCDGRFEKLKI